MKNLLFYLFIALLSMSACNEVQKKEPVMQKEMELAIVDDPDDLPCMNKVSIYPQTAWIWGNSWVSAYNFIYSSNKYPYEESPGLHFEKDLLSQLENSNDDANGVLLYYILEEATGTIPSLAMVNTVNCVPQVSREDSVLVSWYQPKPSANKPNPTHNEFISDSLFSEYQLIWHKVDSSAGQRREGNLPREGYIPVDAYNYSWKTLNSLSTEHGILLKYGARTIDSSENKDFESIINYTKSGNVVACNVLLGWVPGQTFEDAIQRLADNPGEGLDFAKPCPTYCN